MMKSLNKIRKTETFKLKECINLVVKSILLGLLLGVISKFLDESASNTMPFLLETLDLANFLSRMGIWLFLATLLSIYSKSPFEASLKVFTFFLSMLIGYYFYTIVIAGFYPLDYMIIWSIFTLVSPVLAFFVWYAKGKHPLSIVLSALIVMMFLRQTFAFGFWYFDLMYPLELLLLFFIVYVLYINPKQIGTVLSLGMLLFLALSQVAIINGVL